MNEPQLEDTEQEKKENALDTINNNNTIELLTAMDPQMLLLSLGVVMKDIDKAFSQLANVYCVLSVLNTKGYEGLDEQFTKEFDNLRLGLIELFKNMDAPVERIPNESTANDNGIEG